MHRALAWIVGVCLLAPPSTSAAVRLAKVFGDNMVLQQELPIPVWGTAEANEEVGVELAGRSVTAKAAPDGAWRVDLPAMKADGKPHALTARGPSGAVTFRNVLLGEVWLCSGQSNMGRPIFERDAKSANFPQIRLFNSSGETPRAAGLDEITGWVVCSPASVLKTGDGKGTDRRGFSEVAYYFGLKLHQTLKAPVGLIQADCGGSTAKDWTPPPAEVVAKIVSDQPFGGKITHQHGLLYWVRLRGLVPFAIRGVLWYQGEDDGRNNLYARDFKDLIESWRKLWGRSDMPFYYAQIAQTGYAGGMLGVWEAQRWVMDHVPHTGMAVSNDIYEGTDNGGFKRRDDPGLGWPIAGGGNPHPTGKPLVAGRLADIALVGTYGQPDRPIFGPMYGSHEMKGGKVLVKFKYAYGGLKTCDDKEPNWFEVSDGSREGKGLRYVKAQARIADKDVVEAWTPEVKEPKSVRFAWHTLARHNLVNDGNLPAVPFRTDDQADPRLR